MRRPPEKCRKWPHFLSIAAVDGIYCKTAERCGKVNSIALTGRAITGEKAALKQHDGQLWAVSTVYQRLPREPEKTFQLHRKDQHQSWLRKVDGVVLARPYEHLPNAEILPAQEILDKFGGTVKPFTSSIAWMVGMAALQQPDEIAIYGVRMEKAKEYGAQRDGLFFVLGMCQAFGIRVQLNEALSANMKLYQIESR